MEKIIDLQIEIGSRIKYLREKVLKMTQNDFAKKCNLDATYLSRVENGKQNVTIETIEIICGALNVSLKELLNASIK